MDQTPFNQIKFITILKQLLRKHHPYKNLLPSAKSFKMPNLIRILFFAYFFLCSSYTNSATFKDYGQLPSVSRMTLSPNGQTIAFRKFENESDSVVVYSLKDNKILRAIDISSINPQSLEFASDKHLIIRVGDRKRIIGFERGAQNLSAAYALNIKTGKLEQMLKQGDNIYTGQTNIGRIVGLSKNKKYAFMPAYIDPNYDPRTAATFNYGGPFYYALMKVDIESPNHPRKHYKGSKETIDYFINPEKGKIVAEERYSDHSNKHQILAKKGSKKVSVYDETSPLRSISPVGLTPDHKDLVVLRYAQERNSFSYSLLSLSDGKISDTELTRADADVDNVISDINRTVYGAQYSGFLPSYRFFDPKLNKKMDEVVKLFPENAVSLISWSDQFEKLIVYVAGSNYPGHYYLIDEKLHTQFLAASRPGIDTDSVHPIARVTISAKDGLKIPTLLTIPKNAVTAMKNLPAIMLPHGGPHAYDQIGFDWLAQSFANEGFLVIQPQYRGSEGFGFDYYSAGFGEWGGKMLTDIADTLDFFIAKGMVDKSRTCIVGGSYGGYAALAAGAFTPDTYRCVVSFNGVSDMIKFMKDKTNANGRYSDSITYYKRLIGEKSNSSEGLESISPYFHANNFSAPTLIIHGAEDSNVVLGQSQKMARALKKHKKTFKFVQLEGEGHYLQQNETRLQALDEMINFVKTHTK